ncbi:hypothetical protein [Winogradskyella arenosi]|uniref:Uncharacterized protein n=1 Tax=Winogradskyella arenosi TaxID=533325 RepID=A0A368ZGU6_9FLAO|nr:hypothetical protein [Winogradskyella arenosi]RCW92724.1 hypothetical protein DFQ08_102756 [Winogradskyella arenosi]
MLKLNLNKTAINIKTETWMHLISEWQNYGWWVSAKYCGFDAGIDDNFLILRKGMKKIVLGWTNWMEGEIKCSAQTFKYLESEFNLKFEYGPPVSLKLMVILTYHLQSLPLELVKRLGHLK